MLISLVVCWSVWYCIGQTGVCWSVWYRVDQTGVCWSVWYCVGQSVPVNLVHSAKYVAKSADQCDHVVVCFVYQ